MLENQLGVDVPRFWFQRFLLAVDMRELKEAHQYLRIAMKLPGLRYIYLDLAQMIFAILNELQNS